LWDNRERDFGSSPVSPETDGDGTPEWVEQVREHRDLDIPTKTIRMLGDRSRSTQPSPG
jgi:hypothetical protein